MIHGILRGIDWEYLGSVLANESEVEQAAFIRTFVDECNNWGTHHQVETQLAMVNKRLTVEQRKTLEMLSYNSDNAQKEKTNGIN